MISGIDISAVQGVLDWTKVDPAVRFVIHRCGVGNDRTVKDGCFDANIAGAKLSGRAVGAYHFPYPLPGDGTRSPESQAQAHWEASEGVGTLPGELGVWMDLEWPAPQDWPKWHCTAESIKEWALVYLEEMDRLTGRATGIYIYPDYAHHLGDLGAFSGRRLWLASYGSKPVAVAPWGAPTVWQNSGGGGKLYNGAPVDTDLIEDAVFAGLVVPCVV